MFKSSCATVDPNDRFLFLSVILSEWRGHQRSPRCLISPRWVPNSSSISTPWHPVLYLTLPASPYCRIQHWRMKPPPIHRTTTPPTKRSWPPPPVTSGLPCRTWMQNWTLTNKTFLSRVTSHPSLTKTVFLIRLQVRLSCLALFKCTCLCTHAASKLSVTAHCRLAVLGWNSKRARSRFTLCSLSKAIDFCLWHSNSCAGPVPHCPLTSRRATSFQRLYERTHLGHTWTDCLSCIGFSSHLSTAGWHVSPFISLYLNFLILLFQCKIMKLNTWRRLAPPPLWV